MPGEASLSPLEAMSAAHRRGAEAVDKFLQQAAEWAETDPRYAEFIGWLDSLPEQDGDEHDSSGSSSGPDTANIISGLCSEALN